MNRAADIDISKIDIQNVEFQNALKLISYTSQSVFLTGKAGTGKSTFLQYLTHTTKKKFVVLAPTGIAAVNAGGQTLHSFFKLPFKPMLLTDPEVAIDTRLRERMKYSKALVKLIKSLQLIIIDEVSMVRADTIDFIDRLLRLYSGNRRVPFGGKQLLLVGDVFQLEPVVTPDMRDVLLPHYPNGNFFFNARAFDELSVVPIELTKVYRQTDDKFIEMLDRIRVGSPELSDINLLNARVDKNASLIEEDFIMTIATRRDIVDYINEARLDALPGAQQTFVGSTTGEFPDNSLPTDRELVLKEGAQVVFVKNDPERRWVNGTIGVVAAMGEENITVELENGDRHTVIPEVWENVKYDYDEVKKEVREIVIGSFTQLPVKLAWALTIHKSQGLTFDRVIIDVGHGAFSGGQSYVALSRCRSLEGIKLRSTINARDIFVNRRVVEFSRNFNNNALILEALDNAKADDLYHRAAMHFNKGEYRQAIDLFTQAVAVRNELHRPDAARLLRQKLMVIEQLRARNEALEQQVERNRADFLRLATEYVEMAETCRQEGWDSEAALRNYDKALSLSPDYALAYIGKGLTLASMGDMDRAIECLLRASQIDTADYRGLYEAGRLLVCGGGDLTQGMDYLLHALQRNPRIPDIHLALAEGYERFGDADNAAAHRQKAKRLKSKK